MERRPKLVSLDQCYLRFLLRPPPNGNGFVRLRKTLSNAVNAKKVFCPAHVQETIYESVVLPESDRDAIIDLQNELSKGLCFVPFFDILADSTLKLARPSHRILPLDVGRIAFRQGAELKALADEIREAKAAAVARAEQTPYPPSSYREGAGLQGIYQALSRERAASMYRIVAAISSTGSIQTGKQEWEGAQHVGEFLVSQKVTKDECATLKEAVINHDWERIPVYFNHTVLFAKVERDGIEVGRRFTMNDHPDILRVAVALKYSDAITCDTFVKEAIRQVGFENERTGVVFSPKEPERLATWIEGL